MDLLRCEFDDADTEALTGRIVETLERWRRVLQYLQDRTHRSLQTSTCTTVFDLWADRWGRREATGDMIIVAIYRRHGRRL
jgi:hypothetical protein